MKIINIVIVQALTDQLFCIKLVKLTGAPINGKPCESWGRKVMGLLPCCKHVDDRQAAGEQNLYISSTGPGIYGPIVFNNRQHGVQ
jgi:hypothetical protein